MGFAGQLSLGHALYVGLGAYAAAALLSHFGIGPWIGLLVAVPVAAMAGAIIGFLAFRFGVAGVYFAILTIAFCEFARIGFDHFHQRLDRGCFCRSSNTPRTTCGSCAGSSRCSTTSCWPRRCSPCFSAAPRCTAGSAISGGPSARTSRRRARRHRHVPLQDVCGGDLRRHDVVRRRVLRVLLQQPVSRTGVPHFALDRDHPRSDHRRRRHAVRSDSRRLRADGPRRNAHRCAGRGWRRSAGRQAGVLRHLPAVRDHGAAGRRLAWRRPHGRPAGAQTNERAVESRRRQQALSRSGRR